MCYRDAWKDVIGLSNLRKLVLRFSNSFEILDPLAPREGYQPPKADAETVSTPAWSLHFVFPLLETLEVSPYRRFWRRSELSSFPSSLTSLALLSAHVTDGEMLARLPPNLLHLKLECSDAIEPDFFGYLPRQLLSLEVNIRHVVPSFSYSVDSASAYAEFFRGLPRTLTRFKHNTDNIPAASLSELPPSLTELELIEPIEPGNRTSWLSKSFLSYLPPSVVSLTTQFETETTDVESNMWPPRLTHLHLLGSSIEEFFVLNSNGDPYLPSYLQSLYFTGHIKFSDVASLPRGLKSLTATLYADHLTIDFPPHLERLNVLSLELITAETNGDVRFPYESLPASLISITLSGVWIPASQLKHLPLCLKELSADDIFVQRSFEPTALAEAERRRQNFEIGKRQGIIESFDSTAQFSCDAWETLLPRTLRTLVLEAATVCEKKVRYDLFPPNITRLKLKSKRGIDAETVIHFPLKKLRHFEFRLGKHALEDFKMFPRWIPHMTIHSASESARVSPSALLLIPATAILVGQFESFSQSILNVARDDHALDKDPSKFQRLVMCEDQNILDELNLR